MGLTIYGKFSADDKKMLEGIYSGTFTTEQGETEDGAHSERGRAGLRIAVELWKLVDNTKSKELEQILDRVESSENEEGISRMNVAQVKKVFEMLTEINGELGAYFEFDRYFKPDKEEFIKRTLPNWMIEKVEADGGRIVEGVHQGIWKFHEALNYLETAAKLDREVWISS